MRLLFNGLYSYIHIKYTIINIYIYQECSFTITIMHSCIHVYILILTSIVIMKWRLKATIPHCAAFLEIAASAPTPKSPNPAPKYGLSFKVPRISLKGIFTQVVQ